ncbi:hypothetical protein GCM10011360_25340 [Primorskyibacter flagellatus]|uniref:Uncharacterized protein n=1 Tax=Primorskyibacter flagellatus TaxID=1387277 RepID=A0A917AAA3_9RHOB|nr:hypothetical protein GCM10011360_25340 [Primorskyibacter flagellatus]
MDDVVITQTRKKANASYSLSAHTVVTELAETLRGCEEVIEDAARDFAFDRPRDLW